MIPVPVKRIVIVVLLAWCPALDARANSPSCRPDFTRDGMVNPSDLAAFLGCWGPCPCPAGGCFADFNDSGVVDSADLAQLLGCWGDCPCPCNQNAMCDDEDPCTEDACIKGECFNVHAESCCGNGKVEPPEQCDPPDGVSCDNDCQLLLPCPGSGDCCSDNGTPGCADAACCTAVCTEDPFCCDTSWDQICAVQAGDFCPDICEGVSNCCFAHGTPGCDDPACEDLICFIDPFCCRAQWDKACAGFANGAGGCAVCN